ncbi:MAG TPA: type II toxin-antitoxin system HicB family antitoxin [Syntrophomonadaceae bacterium]|nr:type II toxin-antitoxin system HicB family antitoxin [Syntrophomonadaceae bacterium]
MKRYLVVIEKAEGNFSVYLPDVPGCMATGRTPEEAKANIAAALKMHLEGLAEDGLPLPEPTAESDYVTA